MLSDEAPGTFFTLAATETASAHGASAGAPFEGDGATAVRGAMSAGEGALPAGGTVVALREGNGHVFGGLLSGAPAVPTEFLQMMAEALGLGIERAWRQAKLDGLMEIATMWVSDVCEGDKRLQSAVWHAGDASVVGGGTMRLDLTAADGGPAGALVVTCKAGAELNKYMTEILEVTGRLLQEAIGEIAALHIGDPFSWLPEGIAGAENASRLLLPYKLQLYARKVLGELDPKLIAELKSYNDPPPSVYRTCLGVYLLLGRKGKDLGEWSKVRAELKEAIIGEMLAFDAMAKGKKKPWADSRKATKGLSSDEVFKKGSLPVQVMFKWLEIERVVRKVCVKLRKEEAAEAAEGGEGDEELTQDEAAAKLQAVQRGNKARKAA
mmetsp:Transcript_27407/g.69907  ORF Transcript_27407/g.69907 Transcript_27407/m.69907 type:complete len:381 (-) Transcript_27407:75-1217(-)